MGFSIEEFKGRFKRDFAKAALFEVLREHLHPRVDLHSLDAHINDLEFAHALAEKMLGYLQNV